MSKLVKLVYDVAEIRRRHLHVHEAVFHLSARKLVRVLRRDMPDLYTSQASELDELSQLLMTAQAELEDLDDSDLSVRRAGQIQIELGNYVVASSKSIRLLKSICELMLKQAKKDKIYDSGGLQGLKVAYDDAIQYQKRLGTHLNALISAL